MKLHVFTKTKRFLSLSLLGLAVVFIPAGSIAAQPGIIAMGDSLGEGVQAADAAWQTQVFSYLNWVSYQMDGDLSLPYIKTNLFGIVGNTEDRSRIFPARINTNVAVSGATVNSLLYERASALTEEDINTEAELVLYPRLQTQIEYVESAQPAMIICWIGNNDVLSAAFSFGNMNTSQLTPVADFERDYIALTDRLGALVTNNGSKVVFANIPDITDIGFLVDRATAEEMTGFTVELPDGHYTSVIGVLLMKFSGNDDVVGDPNFVLDNEETAEIQDRIQSFNSIIQHQASRVGMPVVDMNAMFADSIVNPPIFAGIPLTTNILGGLFSLDGVHPSNIGHALVANEFIRTMNQAFNMNVPELSQNILTLLFLLDPSIDKDGDGKASGRLGVGLIETLAFLFGFTGDSDDLTPNQAADNSYSY